ncbi:cupin domain-containing protein [uncultured Lactobacillus sp.]|uniref:cupin domain-containing protein n=1 Tax=uncultured Lactobacillus sp. TaxID=153152 RepID=UPI00280636F8|nr:cupin domain-containing protein [uncultured Lactobacillus sp.]
MKFLKKLVQKLTKGDKMSKTATTASNWIKDADAILVTASNGLSISEGLNLFANDKKLKEVLGDLVDKYHLGSLLEATSFPYKSQLDHWRAIARMVEYYGNNYEPSDYMSDIKEIIGDKPYYVWTSNIDHHFALSGFKNVFEMEGNWFEAICSKEPEKHGKYYLGNKLHEIYMKDQDGTLTEDDIPVCDKCGAELDLNMPSESFQVDEEKLVELQKFIEKYMDKNLLVLELGIGPRNQMIKAPSMNMIAAGSNSHYITINQGQLSIPDQIADRSIGFDSSISLAFKELLSGKDMGAKTVGPVKRQKLTPKQIKEQAKALEKFYPYFMIDGARYGGTPMYMTIDKDHPSNLHATEYGQGLMYDMGDPVIVHCFTQQGQYYKVRMGLDKEKDEVHSFYIDPGTFFAVEIVPNGNSGFSVINTEVSNSSAQTLVPKTDTLLRLFPDQRDVINKFSVFD